MKTLMALQPHAVSGNMLMAPPGAKAEAYREAAAITVESTVDQVEQILRAVAAWLPGKAPTGVQFTISGDAFLLPQPPGSQRDAFERYIARYGGSPQPR
jgi:hypothetical protein